MFEIFHDGHGHGARRDSIAIPHCAYPTQKAPASQGKHARKTAQTPPVHRLALAGNTATHKTHMCTYTKWHDVMHLLYRTCTHRSQYVYELQLVPSRYQRHSTTTSTVYTQRLHRTHDSSVVSRQYTVQQYCTRGICSLGKHA